MYDHYLSSFTSANPRAIDEELPRAIIDRVLSGSAETCVDVSIELLQILCNSLSNINGEDDFESLLFRTVKRVGRDFAWLQFDPRARPADPEFELFRLCFAGQAPEQVRANAFLADATIMQRYVELDGQLKRVISVVKVRGSAHSKDVRFLDIDAEQITIGRRLTGYGGILAGQPLCSKRATGTRKSLFLSR